MHINIHIDECGRRKKKRRGGGRFTVFNPFNKSLIIVTEGIMFPLRDTEFVIVTATFQDKKGNAAPVDGKPSWASSDETIVTVEPIAEDPTGLTAKVTGQSKLGDFRVTCQGDADLGEGVVPVTIVGDGTLLASEASTGTIVFGPARPQ
jgi:hypothetical protein